MIVMIDVAGGDDDGMKIILHAFFVVMGLLCVVSADWLPV